MINIHYTDHEKKERKGKLKKGTRFRMDAATGRDQRRRSSGGVFPVCPPIRTKPGVREGVSKMDNKQSHVQYERK